MFREKLIRLMDTLFVYLSRRFHTLLVDWRYYHKFKERPSVSGNKAMSSVIICGAIVNNRNNQDGSVIFRKEHIIFTDSLFLYLPLHFNKLFN